MKQVYLIKPSERTYDAISLDILEMAEKLSENGSGSVDDIIDTLQFLSFNNTSLKKIWPTVLKCSYFKSKEYFFDINVYDCYLVFSQKAYDVFVNKIEFFGEFLPLEVDGDPAMLYHLRTFGREVESACKFKYIDGIQDGLEKLVFDDSDIKEKIIFKSKLRGTSAMYCTDEFKKIYVENGLTGIRFDKDLLSIF